jgi:hypothetical protein
MTWQWDVWKRKEEPKRGISIRAYRYMEFDRWNISFSVDYAQSDAVRSENSVPSPSGAAVQAEWMESGYIRPEIHQGVRHELDGNGDITDKTSVRTKKRRLDPESDFRDHLSRTVLKKSYPLISISFGLKVSRNGIIL